MKNNDMLPKNSKISSKICIRECVRIIKITFRIVVGEEGRWDWHTF